MYSEVTKDKINVFELIKKLNCQGCGSIIEFHGVVRPDGELGEIMPFIMTITKVWHQKF